MTEAKQTDDVVQTDEFPASIPDGVAQADFETRRNEQTDAGTHADDLTAASVLSQDDFDPLRLDASVPEPQTPPNLRLESGHISDLLDHIKEWVRWHTGKP